MWWGRYAHYVYRCLCPWMYLWRPEEVIGYLSLWLFTVFVLRQGLSVTELDTQDFSQGCRIFLSLLPSLGLRGCVVMSGLWVGTGESNSCDLIHWFFSLSWFLLKNSTFVSIDWHPPISWIFLSPGSDCYYSVFCSMILTFLDSVYEWDYAVFIFLHLDYFTYHYIL